MVHGLGLQVVLRVGSVLQRFSGCAAMASSVMWIMLTMGSDGIKCDVIMCWQGSFKLWL